MVRRFLPVLLVLLLLPSCVLAEGQVIDNASLFSSAEIASMEQIISRIESVHQVDMIVLTTMDVPTDYSESMWRIRDYADDFYDQGDYGMGEDDSGMLILLDMNNRAMWLSTGGVMIEYINDSREEDILDTAYAYLRQGDYGKAVIEALAHVERLMKKGRAEGTFLYDEVTGKRLGGIYNTLTVPEMLFSGIAGLVVALIVFASVNGSYNLSGSTYSYDRAANTSVTFVRDDEAFLRQTVRRAARSSGSGSSSGGRSGGSGVHRSSGGVSHGGGGRRF